MGHRNSPATLGSASTIRSPGDGTLTPAPQHRPERAETADLSRTARTLLFAVRVYQTFFSALMPSACKFYPSCSKYASEALRLHGARRGTWLALRRVSRCHPFTRGGVDLVPDPPDHSHDDKAAGQITVHENTRNEVHS